MRHSSTTWSFGDTSMGTLPINGCPWDSTTCCNAAQNGWLQVLQWAHANGCPGENDTNACAYAAQNGHIDVLQWAHANGYL
jgi:hypothetical protein